MNKFWRNNRGAVTVLVTLLIIPSLLLTGTAVDVTRIYAAKSIVADADSLAANSALASYDALLQDLYGLYGIKDETFQGMLDDYIRIAVFGDDNTGRGMGTFQTFYGDPSKLTVDYQQARNLKSTAEMRRQIEEYMKLRAPVVIVERIMEVLDSLGKVSADAKAIQTKMEIDEGMKDIEELYSKIYDLIQKLDKFPKAAEESLNQINGSLDKIHDEFENMYNTRYEYEKAYSDKNVNEQMEMINKYQGELPIEERNNYQNKSPKKIGVLSNIAALAKGEKRYYEVYHKEGKYNEEGKYILGGWQNPRDIANYDTSSLDKSLSYLIGRAKKVTDSYQEVLKNLIKTLNEAEAKKAILKQKLETFKEQLDSCSNDFKRGMEEKQDRYDKKSLMEMYEELLSYDLKKIAEQVNNKNSAVFPNFKKNLGEVGYGKISSGMSGWQNTGILTVDVLSKLNEIEEFAYDYHVKNTGKTNLVLNYKNLTKRQYQYHIDNFPKYTRFEDVSGRDGETEKFYHALQKLFARNDDREATAKDSINKLLKEVQKKMQDLYDSLANNPEGAHKYSGSSESKLSSDLLGKDGDWGSEDVAKDQTKNALDSDLFEQAGSLADDAVNKLLLLTYDMEMFSNYTTNKPKEAKKEEKSLTGRPLGVEINYYYQSEQEFLFNGNKNDAGSNLNAVTGCIILIRFICNYIKAFTLPEVTSVLKPLQALPFPANIIVTELARFAMVMGQTMLDISDLRSGKRVPPFHTSASWKFSVSGLMEEGFNAAASISGVLDHVVNDEGSGLSYGDYITILLLLFVDGDQLIERTQFLIELNLTNYIHREEISDSKDPEKREEREELLKKLSTENKVENLSHYCTGMSITTSAELEMLFLSMPAAQKGINGVVPNATYTIKDTIYRGY